MVRFGKLRGVERGQRAALMLDGRTIGAAEDELRALLARAAGKSGGCGDPALMGEYLRAVPASTPLARALKARFPVEAAREEFGSTRVPGGDVGDGGGADGVSVDVAALMAGVGRGEVLRAVRSGEVGSVRAADGHLLVDAVDVVRWVGTQK